MQSFFCGNIVSVFLALQYLQIAFINDVPDFYCTDVSYLLSHNYTFFVEINSYIITGEYYFTL